MISFNTIHVFGFGKIQVISEAKNGTIDLTASTKLAAFVDHVQSFKPADVVEADYHVIHIFNGFDVKYLGVTGNDFKIKSHFSVKINQLDQTILNDFTAEVIGLIPA